MTDPKFPRTVPTLLAERVGASPEATAFCSERADGSWQPITWRDFGAQVQLLAYSLLRHGLRKGDRLALIAPVSLHWELLHHAALSAGIVVVGLDAHDLPSRVATMCETAGITAVATTHATILSALKPERMQSVRFVLALPGSGDDPPVAGTTNLTFEQLMDAAGTAETLSVPAPEADDTATIIFTSGTTGDPKGIAYNHGQVCLAIEAISDAFPFVGPGSHLLCWLPLSNLFQRMVNLAGMRRGAASYLLGDPRRVIDVVAQVSPDVFVGVPRFYEKLYQGIQARIRELPPMQRKLARWGWSVARRATAYELEGKPTPIALRMTHRLLDRAVLSRLRGVMGNRLRCMVTGSAPTPERLLYEFYAVGWLLLESYGMSENIVPMAMNLVDDFKFGTVGRPLVANDISVDEDGEIAVRGPGMFGGYLSANNKTTQRGYGYYATGDLGSFDEDGYLRVLGRSDDIVKTSTGQKISLPAVEAVLRSVEGIVDAVVIAEGRKYPIAVCTTGLSTSDEQAMQSLDERLRIAVTSCPSLGAPRVIFISNRMLSIDAGEVTANLKLRRKAVELSFAAKIHLLSASDAGVGPNDNALRIHL